MEWMTASSINRVTLGRPVIEEGDGSRKKKIEVAGVERGETLVLVIGRGVCVSV